MARSWSGHVSGKQGWLAATSELERPPHAGEFLGGKARRLEQPVNVIDFRLQQAAGTLDRQGLEEINALLEESVTVR